MAPSGENPMPVTTPVCPARASISAPLVAVQQFGSQVFAGGRQQLAIGRDNDSAVTECLCALDRRLFLTLSRSHSLSTPS